jgi:3-oxoacyl-[acyl-carrier protein] reductase
MSNIKTLLVTGASKGIGLSIVKSFLEDKEENYRIIMVARESEAYTENLHNLRSNYTNEIIDIIADLGKISDVEKMLKTVTKEKYNIDILINNAGYTNPQSFLNASTADFRHTMEVNLIAPFRIIQGIFAAGKHIKYIVNIASTAGIGARPGWVTYASSKAAMISMSDTLREELSAFGTHVVCISPGRCATDLRKTLAPDEDPSTIMQSRNVADTIKYLISDEGRYITSENIIVRQ